MKKNELPYRPHKSFKVPEGYFESLEDRVMASVASSEEEKVLINELGPGFKIPENYFTDFEARLARRKEKKSKVAKVISLFKEESFYYVAAAAAVFIVLLSTPIISEQEQLSVESLEVGAMESYINESMESSTIDIYQAYGENEGEFAIVPSTSPDFDQEAVLQYLTENMEEEPSLIFNEN